MVYKIMVGTIKPEKLQTWNENKEPFDILDERKEIEQINWIEFLSAARRLFTEEVQVDWGSFAFKATKEQLKQLTAEYRATIDNLDNFPDESLGVVFIEIS